MLLLIVRMGNITINSKFFECIMGNITTNSKFFKSIMGNITIDSKFFESIMGNVTYIFSCILALVFHVSDVTLQLSNDLIRFCNL